MLSRHPVLGGNQENILRSVQCQGTLPSEQKCSITPSRRHAKVSYGSIGVSPIRNRQAVFGIPRSSFSSHYSMQLSSAIDEE
jgi:hypothetical protein